MEKQRYGNSYCWRFGGAAKVLCPPPHQGEGAEQLPDADWPASPLRESSVAPTRGKPGAPRHRKCAFSPDDLQAAQGDPCPLDRNRSDPIAPLLLEPHKSPGQCQQQLTEVHTSSLMLTPGHRGSHQLMEVHISSRRLTLAN